MVLIMIVDPYNIGIQMKREELEYLWAMYEDFKMKKNPLVSWFT